MRAASSRASPSGVGHVRIAASNAQVRENRERRNARDRCAACLRDDRLRVLGGAEPVALLESRAAAPRHHVEAPGIEVVPLAIRQSLAQVARAGAVLLALDRHRREVRVRARGVLLKALRERQRQAAVQVVPARIVAGDEPRGAEIVESMTADLVVAGLLRQLQRALRPLHRRVCVRGQHVELRAIAVRHRELRTRRQRFERRDGGSSVFVRFRATTFEPAQA